jgi:hypothetical protein
MASEPAGSTWSLKALASAAAKLSGSVALKLPPTRSVPSDGVASRI